MPQFFSHVKAPLFTKEAKKAGWPDYLKRWFLCKFNDFELVP
jgi:hypothetical protein